MPTRTFRAVMENGDTYDDPSEDVLLLLLEDLAAGDGSWVIVEKVVDASGQTYAQALRLSDGSFRSSVGAEAQTRTRSLPRSLYETRTRC